MPKDDSTHKITCTFNVFTNGLIRNNDIFQAYHAMCDWKDILLQAVNNFRILDFSVSTDAFTGASFGTRIRSLDRHTQKLGGYKAILNVEVAAMSISYLLEVGLHHKCFDMQVLNPVREILTCHETWENWQSISVCKLYSVLLCYSVIYYCYLAQWMTLTC